MSDGKETYRLCAVRKAPLAEPGDLEATLDWLVQKLEADDPVLFALKGYSPAMEAVNVHESDKSRVASFLATSEIEWNFGRESIDPTHEIAFFNGEEGPRQVYFRVSFVAGGAVSAGPGLVAELRLGREAAGPENHERGAHLDKLFTTLLVALHPDYGHVELPGHPMIGERPERYDVGWITYFAQNERPLPPKFPPPAHVQPTEIGTKIFATPVLGVDNYGDVAREIASVRDHLSYKTQAEPIPAAPAGSSGPVQKPTFMQEPAPLPIVDEKTALGIDTKKLLADSLPFAQSPDSSSKSSQQRRTDATPFHHIESPETEDLDPDQLNKPPLGPGPGKRG